MPTHMTFGSPPVTADALVRAMIEMQVFSSAPNGRAEFKAVKARMKHEIARVLDSLGRTCEMDTIHEGHPQEFLYDVVWITRSGTMALAVECETSMYVADVLYDFSTPRHH